MEQQTPFTTEDLSNPKEGYYLAPAVKGGPLVPQSLQREDYNGRPHMTLRIAGGDPNRDWPDIVDRWPYLMGKAVPKDLYDYALDKIAHAQYHDPTDPHARPFEPVDSLHNMPPADAIIAAEKLVETAKELQQDRGNCGALPTADIAERAINAVKLIRMRKENLDETVKAARKAAKAAADTECAEHLRLYGELDDCQAAMQAIAHEARSASDGNITTMLGFTASQRETVAVEVVDKDKVPDDWWTTFVSVVDETRILEAAKAAHKAGEPLPNIPGIKITTIRSTIVK